MNAALNADFDLQPVLQDEQVLLEPLKESDFERLYAAASDPLIWEQHPNKNRYQRTEFENYFKGAMESGGAFLISEKSSGQVIGSSRFYDSDPDKKTVLIGYTFLIRQCWGKQYNYRIKKLMVEHAFKHRESVQFHIGAHNIRSQIAMTRIGGEKIGEIDVAYYGEPVQTNFIYQIMKSKWFSLQANK
jgi:N-acetyltransferase